MKKRVLLASLITCAFIALLAISFFQSNKKETVKTEKELTGLPKKIKKKKKTPEERALFQEARVLDEFNRLQDPNLGVIPKSEKTKELSSAKIAKQRTLTQKVLASNSYINRGPSNLGGRTRTIVVDRSDATGNTILAGGVSGGVFRTTNGGANWTRVSPLDDIPNVTTIIQDPRAGFENIWYYGTGENSSSSSVASSGYYGRGIWQSTDGGLTWSQFAGTDSVQETAGIFDFVYKLAIDPTTGYLFAALPGTILFYLPEGALPPNVGWFTLKSLETSTSQVTDIAITSTGRIYMAFGDRTDPYHEERGVWATNAITTTPTQISLNEFSPNGRPTLAIAPSNENKVYVLFDNGTKSDCDDPTQAPEADLWMWNEGTDTWTDYSSKLPDETGCSDGNDPFAVQNGYDIVVNVKPNDEDFVVIGGTNAYKIEDISVDAMFSRIGGYASASGYSTYSVGGTEHHPDIHAMVFNPFNNDVLFTGSDGGIHKTNNINAASVEWTSLNNNYQTQQYFHVAIDPQTGSDFVLGGLQDNGTNQGGTNVGETNLTEQTRVFSGDGVAVAISRDHVNVPTFVGFQNGPIYRRAKDLTPFFADEITPTGSDSQFVTYFFLDPDNNKTLYYAGNDKVYRTNDATNVTTETWDDMGATSSITDGGISGEFPQVFSTTWGAYNAASSYLLIGTNNGNIYKLNDPQNATNISGAIKITPPSATTNPSTYVSGLAIHPTNSDIVLATYSNYNVNSIYLSTNATSATPTWTLVEGTSLTSHSIRCAAIVEASPGEIVYFVGTGRGLYSTSDPVNVDWSLESPNEIGLALVRSLAYRPSDNHLIIGTHGNGMYEATISSTLGVNDNEDISKQISLYPNPVSSFIRLDFTLSNGTFKYNVVNTSGQSILKGLSTNNQVDVSSLTSGIYFIQLNLNGKTGTKKFIKE